MYKRQTYEIPNPNLSPEQVVSVELGVSLRTDAVETGAAIYYAQIFDLLASVPAKLGGLDTLRRGDTLYRIKWKDNTGHARIAGLEWAGRYSPYDDVNLTGNLTITHGQNTTNDEPVGGIPPLFMRIGIEWTPGEAFFETYVRYAAPQHRLSSDDHDDPRIPRGGTPAWYTLNVRASAQVQDWLKLQWGIENMIDRNYREHGSGINSPGINVILGFEMKR